MHRFRSSASAIKGLTAEILVSPYLHNRQVFLRACTDDEHPQIAAAVIGYDRSPSYSRFAPGQPTTFKDMMRSLDPAAFADGRKLAGIAVSHTTAQELIVGRA